MNKIPSIYTDGSCLKNPNGPSGWAFGVIEEEREWYMSGGTENSTNNRMELFAVIEALYFVQGNMYNIHTDSILTLKCAKKEWKRKANLDLWDLFDRASENKKINWFWVKAHNGNKYNEIVDKMANQEAKKIKNKNKNLVE
jgi:ribonuclease HI